MTYKDLPGFLEALQSKKLLTTIEQEVDPVLEITEIADRVSKQYGNALRFNHVKGSKYPLVINTMGTYERLNMGLGVKNLDEIAEKIHDYLNLSAYATLKGKIRAIPKFLPLPFVFPRKTKHAPCQEVIEEPDLDTLPILQCWPQDGGKYITLPLVFTKDPETGQQNVGMYRMQVYDKKTTGMHWHWHKDGREIYEKYKKLGKPMPVSVALGCDPATIYSATAPLPKMIDEMIFAGYLRKWPVELTRCITNDIYVPSHAEFILEGYVDLDELRMEGPFGDHTGYYSLTDVYPVFHLTKMTRKRNPIYPTTIVGKPPMEDCYLGKATERIFLPLMKIQCPEIVDMDFPLEGVFHNCAIVSYKKAFPLHGNKMLSSLWGLGQMMYTKMIILVDDTVNVHDYAKVAEAILTHVTLPGHLVISEGPLDALDHASDRAFQGFRLGIDASEKLDVESSGRSPLSTNKTKQSVESGDSTIAHSIESLLKTYLTVIPVRKDLGEQPLQKISEAMLSATSTQIIIALDASVDTGDLSTIAWKVFNNIDANRDITTRITSEGYLCIGIDATKKTPADGHLRPWPDDIEMTSEMIDYVTKRWNIYGI